MTRCGYGVEYDCVDARELLRACSTTCFQHAGADRASALTHYSDVGDEADRRVVFGWADQWFVKISLIPVLQAGAEVLLPRRWWM